jgi:hypothetical protein
MITAWRAFHFRAAAVVGQVSNASGVQGATVQSNYYQC